MQIEEYGLQWNIKSVDNVGHVLLKQGSGLVFRGRLEVHPFWGPYIQVNTAIAQKNTYWLIESQCFYSKQLEPLFEETQIHLKKMIPWYHILHDEIKFSKSLFKFNYGDWRMSLAVALKNISDGTRPAPEEIVFNILNNGNHMPIFYVDYYRNRPFLYVKSNIYEKLPQLWSISDLYNLDIEFHRSQKETREYLWHNIARARANKEPVKMIVVDELFKLPHIYTETSVTYGIVFPAVLEQSTAYLGNYEVERS